MRPVNCYAFDAKSSETVLVVSLLLPDGLYPETIIKAGERFFKFDTPDRATECAVFETNDAPLFANADAPAKKEIPVTASAADAIPKGA